MITPQGKDPPPKGYGPAISETLTWGEGLEGLLTEFFLTHIFGQNEV